jgi:hypothetical protein
MQATIIFEDRYGVQYSVTKVFQNERHLENYILKVDGKNGNKYLSYEVITSTPDIDRAK